MLIKSIEEIKEMKLADHGLIINDALNLYLNKKLKIEIIKSPKGAFIFTKY